VISRVLITWSFYCWNSSLEQLAKIYLYWLRSMWKFSALFSTSTLILDLMNDNDRMIITSAWSVSVQIDCRHYRRSMRVYSHNLHNYINLCIKKIIQSHFTCVFIEEMRFDNFLYPHNLHSHINICIRINSESFLFSHSMEKNNFNWLISLYYALCVMQESVLRP